MKNFIFKLLISTVTFLKRISIKNFILFTLSFFTFNSILHAASDDYTLNVDSPSINESAGTTSVNIRVTPQNRNTYIVGDQINLHYETQNSGSTSEATPGSDYTSVSGTLLVSIDTDGTAFIQIPITIIQDTLIEGDEEFALVVTSATANNGQTVDVGDGGLITLVDDENANLPILSIGDALIEEDNVNVPITVSLSTTATSIVSFSYSTLNDTASSGDDYTEIGTTATIGIGQSSVTVDIPILDDSVNEGDETFKVFLSNISNAQGGDVEGIVTITDNDINSTISINNASIAEGDSDKTVTIKILLSTPNTNEITVQYDTLAGSATADVDYTQLNSESITIPANSSEYNLTINIIGDDINEGIEEFYLNISSINLIGPDSYILADGNSTITIFDDDSSGSCSSYVGLITLNEYQNNPHYFDGPRNDPDSKITGNFVEIKYIDFLVKRYVTDDWEVAVLGDSGSQGIEWRDRDLECVDPRYEVFQFDNNVMGARGYVTLKDENGNEVDVLAITDQASDYYTQQCHDFVYDTYYDLSAQNKDLFREPDGTGDWVDHGSGANSGGSRCINKDSPAGLLFTEFDAIDAGVSPGLPIENESDVPIMTKIVNTAFSLDILSIETTDPTSIGQLRDTNITIKAYLADVNGNQLPNTINQPLDVSFQNSNTVTVSGFIYNEAVKIVRVGFEYCGSDDGASADYDTCYNTGNTDDEIYQRRAQSRDAFAIRPQIFDVNITSTDVFIAGSPINLSFKALDGASTPIETVDYNETETTSFAVDINMSDTTKVCQNKTIEMTPNVNFTDGLDLGDFIFHDIGDVNMTIHEINGSEFAIVDDDDTNDTLRLISEFTVPFKIIPHHFNIDANLTDHNTDSNFTYLHDINRYDSDDNYEMGAELNISIQAMGADGNITRNYMETCYAKDTNITLSLNVINITYPGSTPPLDYFLYYNPVEDDGSANAGEGNYTLPSMVLNSLLIENIESTFPSDAVDGNGTTHIEYKLNFDRKQHLVVNPFQIILTDVNITDTAGLEGSQTGITDQNATMYYAQSHASKFFYEDITDPTAITPIAVDVYCDFSDYDDCKDLGINTQTNELYWWLSLGHNATIEDGNVTLQVGSLIEGAGSPSISSATTDPANVRITSGGIQTNVTVTASATQLPMTVLIELVNRVDTSSPGYDVAASPYTNHWLIYNKNSAIEVPSPFYKVRFIGESTWTGEGQTGHVVDVNASYKKSKRVDW